jgi:hypothetical protein
MRIATTDTRLLAEVGDMFLRLGEVWLDLQIINV